MKQLIIDLDENPIEVTINEVLRLVNEGFTSGIEPTWEIVEVD